jgi:hypothetical protein
VAIWKQDWRQVGLVDEKAIFFAPAEAIDGEPNAATQVCFEEEEVGEMVDGDPRVVDVFEVLANGFRCQRRSIEAIGWEAARPQAPTMLSKLGSGEEFQFFEQARPLIGGECRQIGLSRNAHGESDRA